MTSPKIQIAKKLSDFDRATSWIDRIMLRNNGGNNAKPQFFSRNSTNICRLVMTSPKIQIAKKLSDFDRATSWIDRIMLRNNGGNNAKPQFFSRNSTYICRLVMTSPKIQIAKKLSDFDRATSWIDRIMLRNNGGNNAKPQFFSRNSTNICRLVMTSPKMQIAKKLSDFDRTTS